jgi:3-hydroxy acid dehydrogenase/malonic semialdehyde reductase
MSKIILVTGATSGFGKAIAEKFGASGYDVIIAGRRKDRLEQLGKELKDKYGTDSFQLEMDVQDREGVAQAIGNLPERWKAIDLLINNAGLALGRDYFEEASLDDWDTMIDTNLKGLLYVTKAVVPFMINAKGGQIINIGSTAGKEVYEKGNVYCATKHAVDAISKAMRIDLLRHGIKVTAVNPGAADTEFSRVRFKGDEETAAKVYEGYKALAAEDIADICYYCATLPAHVCINDLVVTCTAQANSFLTFKG